MARMTVHLLPGRVALC